LVCFAQTIFYGEIRSITGNFWEAVLMHAVSNSLKHPLAVEHVTYAAGWELVANISNRVIFIVFVGLVGVAIHPWRLKIELS
jgi:hypothetical protein